MRTLPLLWSVEMKADAGRVHAVMYRIPSYWRMLVYDSGANTLMASQLLGLVPDFATTAAFG
jgi:hypothetical protein